MKDAISASLFPCKPRMWSSAPMVNPAPLGCSRSCMGCVRAGIWILMISPGWCPGWKRPRIWASTCMHPSVATRAPSRAILTGMRCPKGGSILSQCATPKMCWSPAIALWKAGFSSRGRLTLPPGRQILWPIARKVAIGAICVHGGKCAPNRRCCCFATRR